MKKAIYVDYENVNISGLKGIEELTNDDVVKIFIGAQTSKLTMVDANRIFNCEATVELITNKYIGKNALDFIIMVHMGYDLAEGLAKSYYIISKDKGYDPAIHEMRKMSGLTIARKEAIAAIDEKAGFGKKIKGIFSLGKDKETPDTTEHTVVGRGKKDDSAISRIKKEYVHENGSPKGKNTSENHNRNNPGKGYGKSNNRGRNKYNSSGRNNKVSGTADETVPVEKTVETRQDKAVEKNVGIQQGKVSEEAGKTRQGKAVEKTVNVGQSVADEKAGKIITGPQQELKKGRETVKTEKSAGNPQVRQAEKPKENLQDRRQAKTTESREVKQAEKPEGNPQDRRQAKTTESRQVRQAEKPEENLQAKQSEKSIERLQADTAEEVTVTESSLTSSDYSGFNKNRSSRRYNNNRNKSNYRKNYHGKNGNHYRKPAGNSVSEDDGSNAPINNTAVGNEGGTGNDNSSEGNSSKSGNKNVSESNSTKAVNNTAGGKNKKAGNNNISEKSKEKNDFSSQTGGDIMSAQPVNKANEPASNHKEPVKEETEYERQRREAFAILEELDRQYD